MGDPALTDPPKLLVRSRAPTGTTMHAPIDRTHTVTITLTVPTIVHLVIGAVIAAAATT